MSSVRISRTDGALVVIALALAAVWLAFPRPLSSDPSRLRDLGDIANHPPSSLVLVRGGSRVELSQATTAAGERSWSVKGRPFARLDPAVTDRFLRALSQLELARIVDPEPQGAGLKQPRLCIEFATGAARWRIALGNMAPSPKGGRYIAITREKEQLFGVVTVSTAEGVDIEPESLLDHRAVDLLPSELHRVELSANGAVTVLERQRGGSWRLPNVAGMRAERNAVSKWLLAITDLRLSRLLDPEQTPRSASRSGMVLSLQAERDSRPTSYVLRLGGACPSASDQAMITIEGERKLAGCIDGEARTRLELDPNTLPDQSVFSLHSDEVDRLSVSGDGASWALEREGAEFRLRAAETKTVALRAGNALLTRVTSVRGQISGRCDFAATHPGRLLSVRSFVVGDDAPTTEAIQFGNALDDGSQKLCRDDNTELTVSPASALQLDVDPVGLRDPQLLDVSIDSVKELRIAFGKRSRLFRLNSHGMFAHVEPAGDRFDAAAIETLRERLSQLSVNSWLPFRGARAVQPRPDDVVLEFAVAAEPAAEDAGNSPRTQERRHQLRLQLDGLHRGVGWFDGQPTPFQADPILVELVANAVREQPR